MKRKIAMLISGVLLIGVISASVLTYFGQITGSVEVGNPILYSSGEHPLGGTVYWGLGINDYVERDTPISFTGANPKVFVSEQLGINSFYAADYKMQIEAESDNENGQIDAELWIIQGDNPNNKKTLICLGSTTIPVYNKDVYEISCSGNELLLDETDRFAWILSDGVNDIHYNVYIKGKTKFEIDIK